MKGHHHHRHHGHHHHQRQLFILAALCCFFGIFNDIPQSTYAAVHSVLTYKNTATQLGQLVTSSTLMWETYAPDDPKQLEFAVKGGKYLTEDEHYPIYVCRVTVDGVETSGYTEKQMQKHVCIASYYKQVRVHHAFDVLMNKGHLGKISWKSWRKFAAGIPTGAIKIGDYSFIARRQRHVINRRQQQSIIIDDAAAAAAAANDNDDDDDDDDQMGADYNLGRLDPSVGLGKILVVEDQNEREYDDGEVLIETEPFRYELRDIVLSRIRSDIRENITELASGILSNKGDKYMLVESVMSYQYDHMQYWGNHEGVARGLPTKVFEKDIPTPTEVKWGLKYAEKRYETKAVHTKLMPGTAINVTLKGNYITLEAPYVAKLYAFYSGIDESVSRKISSEVRKSYLKDVKLEFSPIYWIENGTFLPTTTTTSTTTNPTTTTITGEPKPMRQPPIVHLSDVGHKFAAGGNSHEPNILHNEIPINGSPENYAAENMKHTKNGVDTNDVGVMADSSKDDVTTPSASARIWICWRTVVVAAFISIPMRLIN